VILVNEFSHSLYVYFCVFVSLSTIDGNIICLFDFVIIEFVDVLSVDSGVQLVTLSELSFVHTLNGVSIWATFELCSTKLYTFCNRSC
jgi:hypothetical protein